jgi:hypothetical protein
MVVHCWSTRFRGRMSPSSKQNRRRTTNPHLPRFVYPNGEEEDGEQARKHALSGWDGQCPPHKRKAPGGMGAFLQPGYQGGASTSR